MPATRDALVILILFLIPGFVADSIYGRLTSRQKREATETVLSIVLWTLVNYALWSPVLLWLVLRAAPAGYSQYLLTHLVSLTALAVVVGLVAPVLEAVLAARAVNSGWFGGFVERVLGRRVHTIPKAWDFAFSREEAHLVLITLTDGTKFAAAFGRDSFASEYPAEEDVFFEVVYSVDESGAFGDPLPLSAGLLVKRADIRSLEFFRVTPATEEAE